LYSIEIRFVSVSNAFAPMTKYYIGVYLFLLVPSDARKPEQSRATPNNKDLKIMRSLVA